ALGAPDLDRPEARRERQLLEEPRRKRRGRERRARGREELAFAHAVAWLGLARDRVHGLAVAAGGDRARRDAAVRERLERGEERGRLPHVLCEAEERDAARAGRDHDLGEAGGC